MDDHWRNNMSYCGALLTGWRITSAMHLLVYRVSSPYISDPRFLDRELFIHTYWLILMLRQPYSSPYLTYWKYFRPRSRRLWTFYTQSNNSLVTSAMQNRYLNEFTITYLLTPFDDMSYMIGPYMIGPYLTYWRYC